MSGVAADGSSFTLATGRNGLLQLTVDLQATTVYSEGGASSSITALRTGVKVRVRGTMTAANTITAASVDIAASSSATPTVSVEGTVTAVAASSFTLATGDNALVQITVDVSPTTTYRTSGSEPHPYGPWWGTTTTTTSTTSTTTSTTSTTTTVAPPPLGGVALGDHVEVRGTVSAPNTITATVVDIRSTGGVEVTGRVGVVGSSSFTLLHGRSSLNQITVDVTSSTTYSTFTPGPWRLEPTEEGTTTTTTLPGTTTTVSPTTPGLGSLVANDLVSVRGTVSAPNTITATTIVVLPASGAFPGRHGD